MRAPLEPARHDPHPMTEPANRRPIKARGAPWAKALAAWLAKARVVPDLISAASTAFAALGAAFLVISGVLPPGARWIALLGAAGCIQLRLLCNLLDGMVAVEYDRRSPTGAIWNELPDRFSDILLLVGAGYGVFGLMGDGGEALGWLAAALAVLTAYIRELGRGLGLPADFSGPMAKPQRMAALTIACLIATLEPAWGGKGQVMMIALMVIVIGEVLTVIRRTRNLAAGLRRAG